MANNSILAGMTGKDYMIGGIALVGVAAGVAGIGIGVKNSKRITACEGQIGVLTGQALAHGWDAAPMTVAARRNKAGAKF
jgi:hypothetical protein